MPHRFIAPMRRFIDCPAMPERIAAGDFVLFGAGHGSPYPPSPEMGYDLTTYSAEAPEAIRTASIATSTLMTNHDFDQGGPLMGDGRRGLYDAGDLVLDPGDGPANRVAIEGATRDILRHGGIPILMGGDDSVPIPFLAGFSGRPLHILQVDSHIDWRDVVSGEKQGYSSTMRRASEQPHVKSITQVGMRGVGSAGPAELRAALDWGARLVTVDEAMSLGPKGVAGLIPDGGDVLIQIDLDAYDTSVCGAVNAPNPGGFQFRELAAILKAVIAAHPLAGMSVVELVPARDADGNSAAVAARAICNAIGWALRR